MTCQNSQAQNRGRPPKKNLLENVDANSLGKYRNYVQLQADVSLSSPAVTKVSCTTRDFRPLLRKKIGNQNSTILEVESLALKVHSSRTPDMSLDIQIPPDKVFRYVFGVQITSQEVFGCLGCMILVFLLAKNLWNFSNRFFVGDEISQA